MSVQWPGKRVKRKSKSSSNMHFFFASSIEGIHRILVATSDGSLYVGNIDPRDGGECRITKEFRLFAGPGDPPPDEEERASNVSSPLPLTLVWFPLY